MSARDKAAAFEQWSQGGGSPRAEWVITRMDAAFFVSTLRADAEERERAAVLEGERRIAEIEKLLAAYGEEFEQECLAEGMDAGAAGECRRDFEADHLNDERAA